MVFTLHKGKFFEWEQWRLIDGNRKEAGKAREAVMNSFSKSVLSIRKTNIETHRGIGENYFYGVSPPYVEALLPKQKACPESVEGCLVMQGRNPAKNKSRIRYELAAPSPSKHFLQNNTSPRCVALPSSVTTQGRSLQDGLCRTCCTCPHAKSATQSSYSS